MLVHKKTMGVLDYLWYGEYRTDPGGVRMPLERPARLKDLPELDPADWWEVPAGGPLAKKIRLYYPWIEPEVGPKGELVGVTVWREATEEEKELERLRGQARKRQAADAAARGYSARRRLRPKQLMPFLAKADQQSHEKQDGGMST